MSQGAALRVAVIGFGFCGLMSTANLIRSATAPFTLYVIDPGLSGKGLAFGTHNPEHLLNVPAGRMSAWAAAPEDFVQWLSGKEGKKSILKRGLAHIYVATDFVPRALYGDYLESIWQQAQEEAATKKLEVKLVPARAVHLAPAGNETLTVTTDRGDAIAIDRAVLASGNETRPALAQLEARVVVQNPWQKDVLTPFVATEGPIALLGTGLTAVDMVLSLRRAAYNGPIVALSRRGLLPQPHRPGNREFVLDKEALFARPSLLSLLHYVRRVIAQHEAAGGDWREVIDALRPHTQRLWTRLSTRDQQRFLERLLPYWNVHRHRMAPDVAARLTEEISSGQLRVMSYRRLEATMEGERAMLKTTTLRGVEKTITPTAIINCIGPELRLPRGGQNLLKQLLADGLAEPPPNGLGFAADTHGRVFGEAYPRLYAVGSLLTGQFFESTAVPELRVQAAVIAQQILAQ